MKRTILLFFLFLLPLFSVEAQNVKGPEKCRTCGKLKRECPYKGNHPKSTKYLKVNGYTDNFPVTCYTASGCTYDYTVSTNANSYSVSSNVDWITIDEKDKTSFKLVISKNSSRSNRQGIVTVTADGKTVRMNITHYGVTTRQTTYLKVDNSSDEIQTIECSNPYGCTYSFTVSTDSSDYLVYAMPRWIKVVEGSKTKQGFSIDIAETDSEEPRDEYFLVKAGNLKIKIVVKQVGRTKKTKRIIKTNGLEYRAGMSFLVSGPIVHYGSSTQGGVVNYGVNDLPSCFSGPNYSSGVGFSMHGDVLVPWKNNIYFASGIAFSFHNLSCSFQSYDWTYYSSGTVDVRQQSKEKYHITYLDIPMLAVYKYDLPMKNATLALKGGFVLGVGLSGKIDLNSHTQEEHYTSSGYYSSYQQSNITGTVNLFTGEYSFKQVDYYANNTYTLNRTATAPYNRFSLGLRLGVDLELERFVIGISYNVGLTNMANQTYFNNPSLQVPGYLIQGQPYFYFNTNGMPNYKQSIGNLMIGASYRF